MAHQPTLGNRPAGRSSSRIARLQDKYPVLFASRHVAIAVLKALLPLLGIGAVAAGLLTWLDWSWLQELAATARALLASLGLPLERPDPEPWFVDTTWFSWLKWAVRQIKWVVAIILALLVAVQEVARHRRRQVGHDRCDTAEPPTEQLR